MVASRAVHLFLSGSSVLFMLIYCESPWDLEVSPFDCLGQSKGLLARPVGDHEVVASASFLRPQLVFMNSGLREREGYDLRHTLPRC
ncbi:hypothetical protein B296_00042634 [Ensete ventricosum]|uniref:Secreted protein n=1 Tax=Ensete ventricosum TaxID=4639 RepID=A0A426YRV2_ENSVE|nr:hypothetical protein B296_00042634 [Ensete ventricosum]